MWSLLKECEIPQRIVTVKELHPLARRTLGCILIVIPFLKEAK